MEGRTGTFKLIVLSTPVDEERFDIHIKMSADCTNGQVIRCMVAMIHEFETKVPECWGYALDEVMKEKGI